MSTKIYNGYKLEGITSLVYLNEFCKDFRKKANEVYKELVAQHTANILTDIMDDLYDEKSEKEFLKTLTERVKDEDSKYMCKGKYYPYFYAMQYIRDKAEVSRKSEMRVDSFYDYKCDVVFIPLEGKILALLYTNQREFQELWENKKEVKSYYYQNQSDQPDDISDEEWEQRRKDWDMALPTGVPSESGFIVEFTERFIPFLKVEDVLAKIKPFEDRVGHCARAKAHLDMMIKLCGWKKVFVAGPLAEPTMHIAKLFGKRIEGINKYMWEALHWLESDDGKAAVEKHKEYYRKVLKEDITKEDVLKKFDDYYFERSSKLCQKVSGMRKSLSEKLSKIRKK